MLSARGGGARPAVAMSAVSAVEKQIDVFNISPI